MFLRIAKEGAFMITEHVLVLVASVATLNAFCPEYTRFLAC